MSASKVVHTVSELRAELDGHRREGLRIACVPTMGALHDGHLSLIRLGASSADVVVTTIFVNPTQFGQGEDFEKYPRTLESDASLAFAAGARYVFAPSVAEMYPEGEQTRVRVGELAAGLCGAGRPGHFEGVATVVSKLFNVVGEASYVFGRKDYQQLQVLKRLAKDLLFPAIIMEHPIVREADGLARSSRNVYLSVEERERALSIPRSLAAVNSAFEAGERSCRILREIVRGALDRAGLDVEYVELAQPETLTIYADTELVPSLTLVAIAARAGSTRLIDNLVLGEDPAPESRRSESPGELQ